jgi:hypothetical protein
MRTIIFLMAITALGMTACSDVTLIEEVAPEQPCSIDTVLLATNTSGWVSYQTNDTSLSFENDSGDVKVFHQKYYTESSRTLSWDGVFCNSNEEASRFSNSRSFWYESEDSLLIFGNHYIDYLLPNTPTYDGFAQAPPYEVFLLSMQLLPVDTDTGEIISCVSRRLVNDFGEAKVSDQQMEIEDIALRASVTIGSRQFENVFEPTDCADTAPLFYYSQEDGVVAFLDMDGVAWYKID